MHNLMCAACLHGGIITDGHTPPKNTPATHLDGAGRGYAWCDTHSWSGDVKIETDEGPCCAHAPHPTMAPGQKPYTCAELAVVRSHIREATEDPILERDELCPECGLMGVSNGHPTHYPWCGNAVRGV